jgi:hypothetical protein
MEMHSPYFKWRLDLAYPADIRSTSTFNERMELQLENGEDEEALLLLLKVMHNSPEPKPERLQLDMMVPFAHLVQIYELPAYTSVFVNSLWFTESWATGLLNSPFVEPVELTGIAFCAFVFQQKALFHDATAALICQSHSPIKVQEHIWCFTKQFDGMYLRRKHGKSKTKTNYVKMI